MESAIVSSLVRRHMKGMDAFVFAAPAVDVPVRVELVEGESLIGWYQNPPPWERCFVLFGTRSMYLSEDAGIARVVMDDIVDYELPKSKKNVPGVKVVTCSGSFFVRMAGVHGKDGEFSDAFRLVMFFHALLL